MLEDWQFCFNLKGLVAPVDGITVDNILIRGVHPSNESSIFFKVPVEATKDKSKVEDELISTLRNMVQIYSLVADTYVDVLGQRSRRRINSNSPFGKNKIRVKLTSYPVYTDEKRKMNVPTIKKAISKYKAIKNIFSDGKKAFLRNTIDYYNRSLKDNRLEEKLIDLMISLESMFSNEKSELGLRYSLRTAFLLSVGQQHKRAEIFKTIHSLYNKRSEVVHGTEKVELSRAEISSLQKYVKDAIKILIHVKLSKQEFLKLLDESVYNPKQVPRLTEVVAEAIAKW